MNIDQAVAILQAERVLQAVGAGGPDIEGPSAWLGYVRKAGRVIQGDPLFRNEFKDLSLLNECPCGSDCDGTGDCDDLCKCRD